MQADIAIVIAAFNRPKSLSRLLTSLSHADYQAYTNIPLVISIDHSGNDDCYKVADDFNWPFGQKTVIKHPQNLKLKTHIITCGDLTDKYDAVIMLEDDLFVSPQFYSYAQEAFFFYKDDTALAGIGLYNYRYNEFAYCPFEPMTDGSDIYFMQVPCSCGQLWTKQQWQSFKQYITAETTDESALFMPAEALKWPVKTSWKRSFFKYMVAANKFFVYPRISLTTNFGDVGQHYADSVFIWQTPLLQAKREYRFSTYSTSVCVYDAFFELHEKAYNRLSNQAVSICFDLNGTKPLANISSEYLVSAKHCNKPQSCYLPALYPYECNVIQQVKTEKREAAAFYYGKTTSFTNRQSFDRLTVDVSRTFFHTSYITDAARKEVMQSLPYRLGMLVLLPKRIMQRVVNKIRSLTNHQPNNIR